MRGNVYRPFRHDPVAASPSNDDSGAAGPFCDDVVVDFPSVAPAVDRMRSGFLLDERSRPFSTAIQVTATGASAGTVVPVSVPVRCTCRSCGGRGESWTEVCRRCGGSGAELLAYEVQVTLPPGVSDGTRLLFTVTPPQNPPTRIELRVVVG
jgi:hypothetical protein